MARSNGPVVHSFGPLLQAKFHPHQCNMLHPWGKKPQNRSLSNSNTIALCCAQCCW